MDKTTATDHLANPTCASLFLEFSRNKLLEQYWPRLRGCVESLTDEQVWWRPNEASNSIGNLILHLDGNVRQWLVSSFNRLEDARDRPAEFSARQGFQQAPCCRNWMAPCGKHRRSCRGSPKRSCLPASTFKVPPSPAYMPFTRLLNTSECTTDKSSSSPSWCEASRWVSTVNWIRRAARAESQG